MPIAQIIILKQGIDKPFDQWLQEDITIPRKLIDVTALIGTHKEEDVSGVLYAFGAAVSDPRAANIFNLARKAIKKAAAVSIIPDIDYKEYMTAIKTAVVAIFLVGTMYFLFGMKISELQRTKDNLSTQQMDMADMPVEEIQKKIDDSKIKLKQYNGIVVKNEVADILIHLSKNIPDGVWLTSFSMQLITTSRLEKEQPILQSNWNVNFTAMIYDEDPNKEIRMVNEFMTTLKKDKGLAKYVKNISLVNMTQQEQKDKKVVVINVKGE